MVASVIYEKKENKKKKLSALAGGFRRRRPVMATILSCWLLVLLAYYLGWYAPQHVQRLRAADELFFMSSRHAIQFAQLCRDHRFVVCLFCGTLVLPGFFLRRQGQYYHMGLNACILLFLAAASYFVSSPLEGIADKIRDAFPSDRDLLGL